MTLIAGEDVVPLDRWDLKCACGARATLRTYLKDRPETGDFCAWCVLYSGKTQWGYDNRAEILDVGRAAQELAGKHGKPMPTVDERGRLLPDDANRFMLGVIYSSKLLKRLFPRAAVEEPS